MSCDDFTWIAGPCSMESEKIYNESFLNIQNAMKGRKWIFKASFDKANRTSVKGGRGPGLESGLKILSDFKKKNPDVLITTDVHETYQVEKLAEAGVDIIQIPAFLCRQTDLIVESARHFNIVNVKKGQWLGPENIIKSLDKIKNTNPDCKAWLTERGTILGYHKLIVDFTIVDEIKKHYDKFIFDCTHSTQRSREFYVKQGDPLLAERYVLSAKIMGYDGVFMETHPRPAEAVSDADCQIESRRLENILRKFDKISESLK